VTAGSNAVWAGAVKRGLHILAIRISHDIDAAVYDRLASPG
jgi:hypothetical protein